ncbi:hypothetical protein BASA81_009912 [Batrachochytrium salamandrivorans]|nr:hypothetical protein BASA81_009912 [Batrachochytrium salamandrivorans]
MTTVLATRLALRSVKITKPGDYVLSLKSGNQSVDATWTVRKVGKQKAKNLVLFIGDGMAPSMISAARYLSKPTNFGKFGSNFLEIEKLGTIGKIATNGIGSIITDSANSAAAYLTGQKGWASASNVYADTSADALDDPKVESLAEYIRGNRPDMCIVAADVIFGGGGAYYCPKSNGTSCKSTTDYYSLYKSLGYSVVKNKDQLEAVSTSGPVLGIFAARTYGHVVRSHPPSRESQIEQRVKP